MFAPMPLLLALACRPPGWTPPVPLATRPFTFAVLGDRSDEPNDAAWRQIVTEVDARAPDLVLTVGDLADDCFDPTDWDRALAATARLRAPIAYTPGNHDILDDASAAIFAARTGQAPYRAFDAGGVRFVIVDNAIAETWEQLPEAQRAWLSGELEAHADDVVVVAMHKPFWALGRALGKPDPMHDLFVRTGVDVVFTGHWHNHLYEALDGVRYVGVGTSGGAWRGVVQDPRLGNAYEAVWATVGDDGIALSVQAGGATWPVDLVTRADNGRMREAWLGGVVASAADGAITVRVTGLDAPTAARVTPGGWAVPTPTVTLPAGAISTARIPATPGPGPAPRVTVDLPLPSGRVAPWTVVVDTPREVVAPRGRAVIDGDLAEWTGAGTAAATNVEGVPTRAEATTFWLRHDDDALYFAFHAVDGRPEALHVAHAATERDGNVVYDDRVGMVWVAGPDAWVWFYVTPAGAIWDVRRAEGRFERGWDGVEARSKIVADGWTVEGRVPWAALPAGPDAAWAIDVRRRQERLQEEATFTPAFASRDPARIGRLRLAP